jgi:hypothetical protein
VAGVSGLEPEPKVLETSMLTIDTIPLRLFWILDFGFRIEVGKFFSGSIRNPDIQNPKLTLFIFPMQSVATAATAKLFEFQPVRRILFVFGRYIIAFFALGALQNYVISRHNFLPTF